MDKGVSLDDIERLCWRVTGWKAPQRAVDDLLSAVRAYIEGEGAPPLPQALTRAPVASPEPIAVKITGTFTGVLSPGHDADTPRTLRLTPQSGPGTKQPRKRTRPRPPSVIDPDEKRRTCRRCERTYDVLEYARDTHGLRGRKAVCRLCENARKAAALRLKRAAAAQERDN